MVTSQKYRVHDTVSLLFRDQSADTKVEYLRRQAMGERGGEAVDGNPRDMNANDNSNEIMNMIDNIRGLVEVSQFAPSDIKDLVNEYYT